MLKPNEASLKYKYHGKQITIIWEKNVATDKKYILRTIGLKFWNPKFKTFSKVAHFKIANFIIFFIKC